MNRLSERQFGADASEDTRESPRVQAISTSTTALMVSVDQRRRALEHRLELAKNRLVTDIGRLSTLLSSSAGSMRKGFVRAVLAIGGLLVLAVASAVIRRRRRLRARFL